jgi:hypothetical protein
MYILAKLVFKSYMPKQLEKGMWFKQNHRDIVYGKIYDYITIFELKEVPRDMDSYITVNGAPVEPYIIQPKRNSDLAEDILVRPEYIGWWEYDAGREEDGEWIENIILEDISPKIINEWIYGENGDNDGLIALEVNEDREPITYVDSDGNDTGKVMIKQSDYVDEDEDGAMDVEEDWDDMDDNDDDEYNVKSHE